MLNNRVKVLYLSGFGRSGSTLLHNIVGQHNSIFGAGEVRLIWDYGVLANNLCGCGKPISECDVWQFIFKKLYGDLGDVNAKKVVQYLDECTRTRHLLQQIFQRKFCSKSSELSRILERLYLGIAAATECNVILDSSKNPAYGFLLESIPSIEMYVIHLIRDPRSVAYSRRKRKWDPASQSYLARHSLTKTAVLWMVWNFGTERLWKASPLKSKYRMIRYEDFTVQPRKTVMDILAFVDEDFDDQFIDECSIPLHATHSIAGNPMRFQKGTVQIRRDDAWKQLMPRWQRSFVTLLTWPFLIRYGYFQSF